MSMVLATQPVTQPSQRLTVPMTGSRLTRPSTMDIYLVLCVVWAVIVITGGNLTVLNDTVMSSSLYYKAFNLFNPFL